MPSPVSPELFSARHRKQPIWLPESHHRAFAFADRAAYGIALAGVRRGRIQDETARPYSQISVRPYKRHIKGNCLRYIAQDCLHSHGHSDLRHASKIAKHTVLTESCLEKPRAIAVRFLGSLLVSVAVLYSSLQMCQ